MAVVLLPWESGHITAPLMRILIAIVHYWNPEGGGLHQSLRPDPEPRLQALRAQLQAFRRLDQAQSVLNIAQRAVVPANQALRHQIDVRLITDGQHTVLQRLDPAFRHWAQEVVTQPATGRELGFEAQRYLASQVNQNYDLYAYFEDDLIIHDPLFFHKIRWFLGLMGPSAALLPQRLEWHDGPHVVDRFYIDGPLVEQELRQWIPKPGPTVVFQLPTGDVVFDSPANPHSGCFVLSPQQLRAWTEHPCWQDGDRSFVSPLESAATLGIAKMFQLYKPAYSHASWLEVQHWGTSFHQLIGSSASTEDQSP
jgi:hypothetical protein